MTLERRLKIEEEFQASKRYSSTLFREFEGVLYGITFSHRFGHDLYDVLIHVLVDTFLVLGFDGT